MCKRFSMHFYGGWIVVDNLPKYDNGKQQVFHDCKEYPDRFKAERALKTSRKLNRLV